ncbi:MAG: outer membrane beta-barrel family protein, partial [Duncaniella sp.]|nr:outer membrane beta-barrel family protein [Duncaniella sp.]
SVTLTPEMMPSGTKRYKMAAFNYNHSNRADSWKFEGYVNFEETSNNNYNTAARTNFLSGGNTYDNSFSHSKSSNLKLETRNYQTLEWKKFYLWNMMLGRYIKRSSMSDVISATFNEEQDDVTRHMLEAIYSDGSPEMLDAVINRSVTRSDGHSHEWEVQCFPTLNYKIPRTSDHVRFQLGVKYKDAKEELWRDYNINYGADPVAAVAKRQYFDNSPNRRLTLDGTAEYSTSIGNVGVGVDYSYRFENTDKDSYMYALDRLADMGIYGTVPSGYLAALDPSNSYTSRLMMNRHSVKPKFSWFTNVWPKTELVIQLRPEISLQHDHLDYWRAGRDYLVTRSSVVAVSTRYDASAIFSWGAISNGRRMTYANELRYAFRYDTKTPDLLHMVDVVNDADPLNIAVGNPDLRNEYTRTHNLEWIYNPDGKTLSNTLSGSAAFTTDALVRGYTYDTSTGVRRTRTYNVDGNSIYQVDDSFMLQFGRRQQFTMSASATGSITNYADMIGVNQSEPEQSKVTNHVASGNLKLGWQIGRQSVQLSGSGMLRHTTSSREDFNTINARHFNYGVLGQFVLPYGFGINTDFMFYTRCGYGLSYLDTTDAIWNVRVTYTPRGGRWVFMADGFDLLHQLSNVNYAVNASGRTISYSNALPRYVLFSVQYRLNIQPKKR